jgi:hypothetical protein
VTSYDMLPGDVVIEKEKLDELRAENERLQRACDDYFELTDDLDPPDMLVHWRQDRAKLAAANALLERLVAWPPGAREFVGNQPVPVLGAIIRDAINLLAGQPAAPALEQRMAEMGLHHIGESRADVTRRLAGQPCPFCSHAPCLQTEDCPGGRHHERIKARGGDVQALCADPVVITAADVSEATGVPWKDSQ